MEEDGHVYSSLPGGRGTWCMGLLGLLHTGLLTSSHTLGNLYYKTDSGALEHTPHFPVVVCSVGRATVLFFPPWLHLLPTR